MHQAVFSSSKSNKRKYAGAQCVLCCRRQSDGGEVTAKCQHCSCIRRGPTLSKLFTGAAHEVLPDQLLKRAGSYLVCYSVPSLVLFIHLHLYLQLAKIHMHFPLIDVPMIVKQRAVVIAQSHTQ